MRNEAKFIDFEADFKLKKASHISELAKPDTLVMICTPESSIQMLSKEIPEFDGVLAHCSGASHFDFLHQKHVKKAVIWPMAS